MAAGTGADPTESDSSRRSPIKRLISNLKKVLVAYGPISARGVCMGAADVIPGVSGGTMALVLGIYPRFIAALSNIDLQLLRATFRLVTGAFKLEARTTFFEAAKRADIQFLIALGIGIALAFASLAKVIPTLLVEYPAHMNGFFLGLIIASIVVPFGMMKKRGVAEGVAFVIATAFAYWVTGLAVLNVPASTPFLFVCGAISVSAMLLPGISGSFMLLVLGQYQYLLTALRDFLSGLASFDTQVIGHNLPIILVFVSGLVTGLLLFSRFLKWLFGKHPAPTLAALCGLMVGSLRKIWPYKVDLENPIVVAGKTVAATRNVLPTDAEYTGPILAPILLALVGVILVIGLNRIGRTAVR